VQALALLDNVPASLRPDKFGVFRQSVAADAAPVIANVQAAGQ
jgi:hypothetical protein